MVKALHFHCSESRLDLGEGTKTQKQGSVTPPKKSQNKKQNKPTNRKNSEVSEMSIQMQNPVFIKILIFCSSWIFVCIDFDFLIT